MYIDWQILRMSRWRFQPTDGISKMQLHPHQSLCCSSLLWFGCCIFTKWSDTSGRVSINKIEVCLYTQTTPDLDRTSMISHTKCSPLSTVANNANIKLFLCPEWKKLQSMGQSVSQSIIQSSIEKQSLTTYLFFSVKLLQKLSRTNIHFFVFGTRDMSYFS